MIESNSILYAKGEKPDHTVSSLAYNIEDVFNIFTCTGCDQIYFIHFWDSKRAIDEYTYQKSKWMDTTLL